MTPDHLMSRVEKEYGSDITRSAKKYTSVGSDWQDAYQDILIGVHDRVRRGKVCLKDKVSMRNTIRQRAIEQSRKSLLYRQRFVQVEKVSETARYSDPPENILEKMRIAELKYRIRKRLPPLDARIVIALAFPSSALQTMARRRPTQKGPIRKKAEYIRRNGKGRFSGIENPDVRRWHIAKMLGVSTVRVAEATKKAQEIFGDIIEQEGG